MNPQTRMFIDDLGRTRIFHGFNAVVKSAPYIPITDHFDPQMSLSDQDIANLTDWGFNFIRLGVMWQAVEPLPQVYNTTYLGEVNNLINKLGAAGIYTLVDAHQDLFAKQFCGEGVPEFYAGNVSSSCNYGIASSILSKVMGCTTMKSFDLDYEEDGIPTVDSCLKHPFLGYYSTAEVASAFANLYNNVNGIRDRFLDFWNVTSAAFANNPYVLGYDPINEPFLANFWEHPALLLPGKFDRQVLQSLYQDFNAVVRQNTKDQIVFFEPTTLDALPILGGIINHVGFDQTPGGPAEDAYQILNDHTYCCAAGSDICATGEPTMKQAKKCRDYHEKKLAKRSKDAEKLGVGLIITEFGACSSSEACMAEIDSVADACDHHLVGWAYWMFKGFADYTTTGSYTEGLYSQDGTLQTNKLKELSRTYVQAYQGVPLSVAFDSSTGDFKASYEVDPSIAGSTELYFNGGLYYPNGYDFTIKNSAGLLYDVETYNNKLTVTFQQGQKSTTTIHFFAK
jgi:endoglycosylceramidase